MPPNSEEVSLDRGCFHGEGFGCVEYKSYRLTDTVETLHAGRLRCLLCGLSVRLDVAIGPA